MNVRLSTAWAAEARADGSTRQTPLLQALKDNNADVLNGLKREWLIVGVFESMERAMAHNRELKAEFKRWREREKKQEDEHVLHEDTEAGDAVPEAGRHGDVRELRDGEAYHMRHA
jgi:hypothetical protein